MLDLDASRIWRAITVRGTTAELAEEIAIPSGYDVAATAAAIRACVDQMIASGILTDTDRRPPKRRRWWRR